MNENEFDLYCSPEKPVTRKSPTNLNLTQNQRLNMKVMAASKESEAFR